MGLEPLVNTKDVILAIFMSGTGSNATKILERFIMDKDDNKTTFYPNLIFTDNPNSKAKEIGNSFKERGLKIPVICVDIKGFKSKFTDKLDKRKEYDENTAKIIRNYGINMVALAGYDWIVTNELLDAYPTILNVHPGDLRVRDEKGKRKYVGLGWVPSAKAILNGESKGHSSVHLVTPELDGGPLLAVSAPQYLDMDHLANITKLCGDANDIKEIQKYIKENPEASDKQLRKMFPVYSTAKDLQERLKVNGDWIIFPETIARVANQDYKKDGKGGIYYEDKQLNENNIDKLVLF
ncbi:MAG: formyltransferase family protein [Candidatus Nanoarchaeia archaeon]|nr:formyltransferase family protein [Candidatus Nanoarchaeia archaeon]